jgi:hypothetical protein
MLSLISFRRRKNISRGENTKPTYANSSGENISNSEVMGVRGTRRRGKRKRRRVIA